MDVTDAVFAKKHKISIPRLSSKLQPFHHETIDMQIKWFWVAICIIMICATFIFCSRC